MNKEDRLQDIQPDPGTNFGRLKVIATQGLSKKTPAGLMVQTKERLQGM